MRGSISSGSIYTSEAGRYAFQQGGNAIDAAICAQLTACVTEPLLTGFGGAGLAMVKHEGQHHFVDMFTTMPDLSGATWTPDNLREVILDFGSTTQSFWVGAESVAVPTVPQGLLSMHERFGSLPLEVLIKPGCTYAEDGFIINAMSAFILDLLYPIYQDNEDMCRWYLKNGRPLKEGDRCTPTEFSKDFQCFAKEKALFWDVVYKDKTLHNSIYENISRYKTRIRNPKVINTVNGKCYLPTMPSIGAYIAEHLLSDISSLHTDSVHGIEQFVTATKQAQEGVDSAISDFYTPENLGFTTHISTVDEFGNACSLTTSLGESSGSTIPGTGIVLNNFLGEADVAHPLAVQQVHRRLITMCTPMIFETATKVAAIGSGGSSRIPYAIVQVLMNVLEHQMTWQDAIQAPRIFPNISENIELCIETHGLSQNFLQALQEQLGPNLKPFNEPSMFFGGVHVAARNIRGDQVSFEGFADPRRSGSYL